MKLLSFTIFKKRTGPLKGHYVEQKKFRAANGKIQTNESIYVGLIATGKNPSLKFLLRN